MDTRTERFKRIRGAMLKMLAKEHPGSVDHQVLTALIEELGFDIDEKECQGHVEYLAEKGYAKKEKRKAGGIEIILVTISAKGLDLLDNLTEDVGVDVRF